MIFSLLFISTWRCLWMAILVQVRKQRRRLHQGSDAFQFAVDFERVSKQAAMLFSLLLASAMSLITTEPVFWRCTAKNPSSDASQLATGLQSDSYSMTTGL